MLITFKNLSYEILGFLRWPSAAHKSEPGWAPETVDLLLRFVLWIVYSSFSPSVPVASVFHNNIPFLAVELFKIFWKINDPVFTIFPLGLKLFKKAHKKLESFQFVRSSR